MSGGNEPDEDVDANSKSLTSSDFESLMAIHRMAIAAYIYSLLPGYGEVEDVTQEVMLTIWKKKKDFEAGTNFKAWAFRIAHFHVQNQRRKIARRKWLVFDEEVLEQLNTTAVLDEVSGISAEHEALELCLQEVSVKNRELLHTRYATKTSIETFAEQTGQRPGTLKARLFRIRSSLRKCIEERLAKK